MAANIPNRDAQDADRIVRQLLNDNEAPRGFDIENDIVLSDLEVSAAEFTSELDILESFDANVPAIRGPEQQLVPVSLRAYFGQSWPFVSTVDLRNAGPAWYRHPLVQTFLFDVLQPLRNNDGPKGFYTLDRREARRTFIRGAVNFLTTRIAALRNFRERGPGQEWGKLALLRFRQRNGGPQVITPGCQFKVSTNSIGLRVHWSGAYWISPNYFSHPTSPASSVLQTGIYIFGVDGGAYGNNIQWDTNAVVTLPGRPYVHLNF